MIGRLFCFCFCFWNSTFRCIDDWLINVIKVTGRTVDNTIDGNVVFRLEDYILEMKDFSGVNMKFPFEKSKDPNQGNGVSI